MQRVNETFGQSFAEAYQSLHQEIENELEISYIYNTNRLEGRYFTKRATKQVLRGIPVRKSRFKSKDIAAVQSQQRAIKFVKDIASTLDYNVLEADIKHIHSMISEHLGVNSNPGKYRINDVDSTIPVFEIPKAMKELVDFVNNKGGAFYKFRPVERAACIHYRFSQIQPFSNLNGSVARLLMNFILIKYNRPLTVIKANDKKEYLDSLSKEDSIYFLQFITERVLDATNAYLVMIKERLISDDIRAKNSIKRQH
jgi:Fic family protein